MNNITKERYFIGVDVGTGSVRSALVNQKGKIIKTFTKEIKIWNPQPDFYEQSSEDIWQACCHTIKVMKDFKSKESFYLYNIMLLDI